MRDIQMPIGSVGDKNVAVRAMRISDLVNLHVGRQNIYNYCVVQRNYAGADLFSSDKLTVGRIHSEEIAFHADQRSLVAFHYAYEMPLADSRKKLSMNNVNVFACVKDHKLVELGFAWVAREGVTFSPDGITSVR